MSRLLGALPTDLRVVDATANADAPLPHVIARGFRFPDYFRGSWDSVEACLCDLAWLPAPGYVLLVRNASALWAHDYISAAQLTKAWLAAAEDWAQHGRPFHLVFVR
jgi:hypothetical protein